MCHLAVSLYLNPLLDCSRYLGWQLWELLKEIALSFQFVYEIGLCALILMEIEHCIVAVIKNMSDALRDVLTTPRSKGTGSSQQPKCRLLQAKSNPPLLGSASLYRTVPATFLNCSVQRDAPLIFSADEFLTIYMP